MIEISLFVYFFLYSQCKYDRSRAVLNYLMTVPVLSEKSKLQTNLPVFQLVVWERDVGNAIDFPIIMISF